MEGSRVAADDIELDLGRSRMDQESLAKVNRVAFRSRGRSLGEVEFERKGQNESEGKIKY